MSNAGHGQFSEITEGDFLEVVTKTDMVVVHFFHHDFERCKLVDKHLQILARKYFETRFIKISAPVSNGTCKAEGDLLTSWLGRPCMVMNPVVAERRKRLGCCSLSLSNECFLTLSLYAQMALRLHDGLCAVVLLPTCVIT